MTKKEIADTREWFNEPERLHSHYLVHKCLDEIDQLTAQLDECRKLRNSMIQDMGKR